MVGPGSSHGDRAFTAAIPQVYERDLVPLIFEPYAIDAAERVAALAPRRVLELACGTGVVTRALAKRLPPDVEIVATDLNQTMLDVAQGVGTARPVTFRQADAMRLRFDDESFDVIVCQFGAMFFPDKAAAFAESRRALKHGGTFLFSVWDRIEENEFADVVTRAISERYPRSAPFFLARTPHGYHDRSAIARDVAGGGFTSAPTIDTVTHRSRASSARVPAVAYVEGTPMRNEIVAIDPGGLEAATDLATEGIARRFGRERVDGKIQAIVVSVKR